MLQSLVDLARQTSLESRRDVLHAVAQLFVEGAEAHNDRELELFGEILERLADQVSEADRFALSRRVAPRPETPRRLALKLAGDTALVAAPILEFSPVLTVPDLVSLAGIGDQIQLQAIARRVGISEPITDVIVERGELLVLNTLTRNLSARLSLGAFERIGARAIAHDLLGEALSLREDLPVPVAHTILATLDPSSRKRVDLLLRKSGDRVADLMGRAVKLLDSARSEQTQHRAEVRKMIADIRSHHRDLDDATDELIFQKRLSDIAMLLAGLANLTETHVMNALHKVNTSGIAAICRSLNLGPTTFRRLSCLRCERLRLPISQADQMLRDYARINAEMAEQFLRFHRVRNRQTAGGRP